MNIEIIKSTPLFKGLELNEINDCIVSLKHKINNFLKEETILENSSFTNELGIILAGSVRIENIDYLGNKMIVNILKAGDIFAEAYAIAENEPLLIDAVANEDTKILLININNIFSLNDNYKNKILKNLLNVCAKKSLELSKRSIHLSYKKIRERVLSYLNYQASIQGTNIITITFNREQLAQYLNLDRSALSKELGKMQKEGIINYKKNIFIIL